MGRVDAGPMQQLRKRPLLVVTAYLRLFATSWSPALSSLSPMLVASMRAVTAWPCLNSTPSGANMFSASTYSYNKVSRTRKSTEKCTLRGWRLSGLQPCLFSSSTAFC